MSVLMFTATVVGPLLRRITIPRVDPHAFHVGASRQIGGSLRMAATRLSH
jgi:hypothetical protein